MEVVCVCDSVVRERRWKRRGGLGLGGSSALRVGRFPGNSRGRKEEKKERKKEEKERKKVGGVVFLGGEGKAAPGVGGALMPTVSSLSPALCHGGN